MTLTGLRERGAERGSPIYSNWITQPCERASPIRFIRRRKIYGAGPLLKPSLYSLPARARTDITHTHTRAAVRIRRRRESKSLRIFDALSARNRESERGKIRRVRKEFARALLPSHARLLAAAAAAAAATDERRMYIPIPGAAD